MLEQAQREGRSLGRDDLRAMPKVERDRLRNLAFDALPEHCILDIHLSTRTTQGLEPAVPTELTLRLLGRIVVMQADPAAILARRKQRLGRNDPCDTVDDIAEQQEFNLEIARQLDSDGVILVDANRNLAAAGKAVGEALQT